MRGARLEDDDVDALLGEFVAKRAAAGAGADDDDHAVVVEIIMVLPWFPPNDVWLCAGEIEAASEPLDVVKTARDVAALGEGLALVAEDRPYLLLVVEADNEAAADRLEERRVLDLAAAP